MTTTAPNTLAAEIIETLQFVLGELQAISDDLAQTPGSGKGKEE